MGMQQGIYGDRAIEHDGTRFLACAVPNSMHGFMISFQRLFGLVEMPSARQNRMKDV
jgi:hypothetical protein